jgi:hypothetical protein
VQGATKKLIGNPKFCGYRLNLWRIRSGIESKEWRPEFPALDDLP